MSILRSLVMATSVHGRRLGLDRQGALMGNEKEITSGTLDAVINVGANQAAGISVQLNDNDGNAIAYRELVEVHVLLNASGSDWAATGGSTGIAIGANGKLLTVVSKKLFKAISDPTGLIKLTWTDTGAEAAYLGIKLPNGRVVISAALPTA